MMLLLVCRRAVQALLLAMLCLLHMHVQATEAEAAPRIQVAILNRVDFHHEVYPALHHAWTRAGYDVVTYALRGESKDMRGITTNWGFTFRNDTRFMKSFCKYKIVIFSSAEYKRDYYTASRLVSKACDGWTKYVVVVHNPDSLTESRLQKLVMQNPNIYIIALGPHTAAAINVILKDNNDSRIAEYIIPLFPIDSPAAQDTHDGFVVQGSVHKSRRNYSGLVGSIAEYSNKGHSKFKVVVLGSNGKIKIPVEAEDFVELRYNLPYPEYYRVIQHSFGLLTAFSTDVYFEKKASSSVAASMICGTPLLTQSETLKAYSFLSESSVWLRHSEESDVSAMDRIIKMDNIEEEYNKRRLSLQNDIENAHVHNTVTIDKIMSTLMGLPTGKNI
jgi:hypothetical protein